MCSKADDARIDPPNYPPPPHPDKEPPQPTKTLLDWLLGR